MQINKWLGLNEDDTGETQLELGQSPFMRNFTVTDNYKLRKRPGYKELFSSLGVKYIQGQWYGKIQGTFYHLFCYGGNLYKRISGVNTIVGTLTDAPTFFIAFSEKVYLLNGYEYKSFDGTTLIDVVGYRPRITISTPPTGGGTLFEPVNLLTGAKEQSFSGNGTATEFQLAETNITSVDFVYVNEVLKVLGTDYTVNLVTGKVTFTVAPPNNADNVRIGFTKGTGDRSKITKCRFAMSYGGSNDTRLFFWGNTDFKHRRYYSDLGAGVPNAEYIPVNNFSNIGTDEFAITDIVRQYDRQIIFKENEAYYSYYEMLDGTGSFPVYPLNSVKGQVAEKQTQIINNNPVTIQSGIYEWVASSVRDERNAQYLSKRIQPSLDAVDLTKAITIDFEEKGEYWLCVDSTVWIYNYRNDTFYVYDNIEAKNFLIIDGELYFGTKGTIMKFEDGYRADNGQKIKCIWQMGFYDFGEQNRKKFINKKVWLSFQPQNKTGANITWQTDKDPQNTVNYAAVYNLLDFGSIDFANFSFLTYYNPQPLRVKIKAKKFVYFKLIIENDSLDETLTLLSIIIENTVGGNVK